MPPETLEETTRNHKVVPRSSYTWGYNDFYRYSYNPSNPSISIYRGYNNNPSYPFIAGSYGSHLVASSFRSTMNLEKPRLHQETKRSEGFQNETTNVSKDIWQLLFFHMGFHGVTRPEETPTKNPGV